MSDFIPQEAALYTDQYTLTMGQSFFRHNTHEDMTAYELFVRKLPENRSFLLFAGLAQAIEYLENFHFSESDIQFLREMEIYDEDYLQHLSQLRFNGTLYSLPEGSVATQEMPLLRVEANRLEATIIESILLTLINHQTMIASKAARIKNVSKDKDLWDFSLRRLHGPHAANAVARASYIAGFKGTATVHAGKSLGIKTTGTMAHHYVQSFGRENEKEAFTTFLNDYPDNGVLLVDTYDTLNGVENVVLAAKETGITPKAIRLDSGDLGELAKQARIILDENGLKETGIFASGDLDEYKMEKLSSSAIDGFGVGTMLGTSADHPNLGGVYKLVQQKDTPIMKLAPDKQTDPGLHQVWRQTRNGYRLILGMKDEQQGGDKLLHKIIENGRVIVKEDLQEVRLRAQREMDLLPEEFKDINSQNKLIVERTTLLQSLKMKLGGSK